MNIDILLMGFRSIRITGLKKATAFHMSEEEKKKRKKLNRVNLNYLEMYMTRYIYIRLILMKRGPIEKNGIVRNTWLPLYVTNKKLVKKDKTDGLT